MSRKIKYPVLPKLYKILENGKSCNGGEYTWNTDGGVNSLPARHSALPLNPCSVGFHLTTDWQSWYEFGRDVYTATVPDGEVLVSCDNYTGECEDKVVARSVVLSEKNQDPLAKLLKNFYNDVVAVSRKLVHYGYGPNSSRLTIPNNAMVCNLWSNYEKLNHDLSSDVSLGRGWSIKGDIIHQEELRRTLQFIIPILEKSVSGKITATQRQAVHDVWNLWKAGWIVYGVVSIGKHAGKYAVR